MSSFICVWINDNVRPNSDKIQRFYEQKCFDYCAQFYPHACWARIDGVEHANDHDIVSHITVELRTGIPMEKVTTRPDEPTQAILDHNGFPRHHIIIDTADRAWIKKESRSRSRFPRLWTKTPVDAGTLGPNPWS